ncbi:transmembrane protein 60 isoform X3 [Mustela erminea]|uniref:transmembrane protein 60 isoform X3 n=1 Tax=Mustela erminea TaxID=36723 RepID=UPI001387315D|nr:transmembrane protein 60 isoform X3 [Mustela erminea]
MEEKAWKRPRIQTGEFSDLRGPPRSPASGAARFYFISSTTVIHSHEDISSICSPMNRLGESPNLWVVSRTSDGHRKKEYG